MSFSWSQYFSQAMAPTTGSALTAGKSSYFNFLSTSPANKSKKPPLIQRLDSVGESTSSFDDAPYIENNSCGNMASHEFDKFNTSVYTGKNNWSSPTHCQMHIPSLSQGTSVHNNQFLCTGYKPFSAQTLCQDHLYCNTPSHLEVPLFAHVKGQLLQYIPTGTASPASTKSASNCRNQELYKTKMKSEQNYFQPSRPTASTNGRSSHQQTHPVYHLFQSAQAQQIYQPTMATQQNLSPTSFGSEEFFFSKLDQVTQNLGSLSVTPGSSSQVTDCDFNLEGGSMATKGLVSHRGASGNISLDQNLDELGTDCKKSMECNNLNPTMKLETPKPGAVNKKEQQEKQQKETAKIDISVFDEAVLASENLACDILLEMSDIIPKKNCENNMCRTPKAQTRTKVFVESSTVTTPTGCFRQPKVPVSKKKARPSAKKRRRLKKQRGEIQYETPKARSQNPQKRLKTDSCSMENNDEMPTTPLSIPSRFFQTTCVSFQISPLSSDSSDEGFDNDDEDYTDWDESVEQQWDTFSLEMFQSPLTLTSNKKTPVLIGNIKIHISPQSTDMSPRTCELANINSKWNACYSAEPKKGHLKSAKVSFADSPTSVHEADNIERKGHWEQFAIDRCRFKQRVAEVEREISYIFLPHHRQNIYHKLFLPE